MDGALSIGAVRKVHEAQYTCTATNAAGTDTATTIIYVSEAGGQLGEVQPEQVSVRPGQPIRITCRARDPSAIVSWRGDGRRLPQVGARHTPIRIAVVGRFCTRFSAGLVVWNGYLSRVV